VDEPRRTFDVSETMVLIGELCQRFAAMRKTSLELIPAPVQVQITNNPFLFQYLLFLVLDGVMNAAGPPGPVRVEVLDAERSARVLFTGTFPPVPPGPEQAPALGLVLQLLGGSLKPHRDPPGLALDLPKDLKNV
jgi:hypothetical protein